MGRESRRIEEGVVVDVRAGEYDRVVKGIMVRGSSGSERGSVVW